MPDESGPGLRDKIARQGEDALGKLAQELLENPMVNSAIARAFGARERAVQAQEAAMGALNLPSAADVERLTRRLRSVSQRMEGIEEAVDRLDERLAGISAKAPAAPTGLDERLDAVESQLRKLGSEIAHLSNALDSSPAPVPREQERLEVDAVAAASKKAASTSRASKPKGSAAKKSG
jgi:CRP-like cAMP-binding protein